MATDAEGTADGVEEATDTAPVEGPEDSVEDATDTAPEDAFDDGFVEETTDGPPVVEVWDDYDPSMRFVAVFPVGEDQGATLSAVAYYIIEPGKHSGLHSDNVEEVVFVAEGSGEAFVTGKQIKFNQGEFVVLPAGMEHDIYAYGADALRLLSFFPTTEIISTFQQTIFPMGGNILTSKLPKGPVVQELDPDNLPDDFPFDLAELGMAPGGAATESEAPEQPAEAGPEEPPADE